MSVSSVFRNGIKNLSPGYFAAVMATGIISTGLQQLQFTLPGKLLFILNNCLYCIVLLLFISRLILYFPEFKKDLSSHQKGAGFLTFIAGSSILGTEWVQGKQMFVIGTALCTIGLIAWINFIYSFLALVILKEEKPSPEKAMNGSWLLLTVSTQSLVILGTALAPHLPFAQDEFMFTLLAAWLAGVVLYVILITIIIYRLLFFPLNPSEISPSFWIDTGAAAISVLAGVTLSSSLTQVPALQQFIPAINLLSMLLWAAGTFWLPLLFILEIWRHIKSGFTYSPDYWSLVFPLGMYTVATLKLSTVIQNPSLTSIASVFIYIALMAWVVVFVAMLSSLMKMLSKAKQDI